MLALVETTNIVLDVFVWIIIAQIVLGWLIVFNVIPPTNQAVRQVMDALGQLTEPVYRPIRRLLPDTGAIDFTPMVVILAVMITQRVLLPSLLSAF